MQEGADARDEENGADEVALGQRVMLQAEVLGQDERHSHEAPQGCKEVLWAEQKEVGIVVLLAGGICIPQSRSASSQECPPMARSETPAAGV